MRFVLEKDGDRSVLTLKGSWVTERVIAAAVAALNLKLWNSKYTWSSETKDLYNHTFVVEFHRGTEASHNEVVDYLEIVCRPHIGSGFTSINASPYNLPDYGDRGGLTALSEIGKEVGLAWSSNPDGGYVTFHPESNVKYNQLVALLDEFKITHNARR